MEWAYVAGLLIVLGGTQRAMSQSLYQPKKPHAVLVELFASEGCAACRPADDLLWRIDGTGAEQSLLIVGISEHVKLMDGYGWKDPYGLETLTYRQAEYSKKFSLEEVYTPQIVVNGEMQMVGLKEDEVMEAITRAGHESVLATVHIASLKVDGGKVSATIAVEGVLPPHGVDLFAAIAEDETTEHVLRGENKGKTLAHASVVRAMTRVGRVKTVGESTMRMKVPKEISALTGTRRHLIVWAQKPDMGRVMDVDSQAF